MQPEIVQAIIAAVAGILVALIGQLPLKTWLSRRARRRDNIPETVETRVSDTRWKTKWKTVWYLAAIMAAVLVAVIGQDPVRDMLSQRARKIDNIPEITDTKWQADWYLENGTLYASDTVTFWKWTKNNQFEGYGEVTHEGKQYKYSISGEVSPSRVVVLTYKAERFPTEANIGTASLQLSSNAEGLDGSWAGLVSSKESDGSSLTRLRGGKVVMKRIKSGQSSG